MLKVYTRDDIGPVNYFIQSEEESPTGASSSLATSVGEKGQMSQECFS